VQFTKHQLCLSMCGGVQVVNKSVKVHLISCFCQTLCQMKYTCSEFLAQCLLMCSFCGTCGVGTPTDLGFKLVPAQVEPRPVCCHFQATQCRQHTHTTIQLTVYHTKQHPPTFNASTNTSNLWSVKLYTSCSPCSL
jgi:hypothetical protein